MRLLLFEKKELNEDTLIYNANMTEMKPEVGHQLPIEMYREGYEYYVETHFSSLIVIHVFTKKLDGFDGL